ncbi:MAG: hypothetical protein AAGA59_24455 [Actinomycetota bacterium]
MSTPMSTPTRPTGSPPAPTGTPRRSTASTKAPSGGRSFDGWSTGNSMGWYRLNAVIAVVAIAATAIVATTGAFLMRSATVSIQDNTAPSLIAVQGLSASVAEANSNATAAFLSAAEGEEDRQRRVAYLDALRRSAEETEEVAGLIDDDEARHRDLKDVAVALTSYSGSIEAARAAVRNGDPEAVDNLTTALDLTGSGVADSVARVTDANQQRFDNQLTSGMWLTLIGLVLAIGTLLLLLRMQRRMFALSNRLLNPGMLLATLAVLLTVVALTFSFLARQSALVNASDGGYDAIAATSRLQATANDVQTALSLRLLGGTSDVDVESPFASLSGDVDIIADLADSNREQAAAQALEVRLSRYESATNDILFLAEQGDTDAAIDAFRGSGFSTFNGLNTSIESVLSDNRAQFTDGVDGAASAVNPLPLLTLVLPVLAAIGVVFGVQRRLSDYQ